MVTVTSPTFCEPPLFIGRVLLDALRFQPVAGLENSHHFRRKTLRQRYGVVHVVEVPVRDADRIHALDLVPLRVRRVALGPRVHQDDLARGKPK